MKLMEFLDRISADYETSDHQPTFTAQQMASQQHVPGIKVAKPVIVKADGVFYMCVLPASYKIDFDTLKRLIGADEIELATPFASSPTPTPASMAQMLQKPSSMN